MTFDAFRLPTPGDVSAPAYKDWLHLNVFLPDEGVVALINVSLHGPPSDNRSRAVGVALAFEPEEGWLGAIEIGGYDDANVSTHSLFFEQISLSATLDRQRLLAAVRMPEEGLVGDIVATPLIQASRFQAGFGSGWIGWNIVPMLQLEGVLQVGGRKLSLHQALGYHDHNWGRWFWGEDIAWEWGTFVFSDKTMLVFARSSDKEHRSVGAAHLFLIHNSRKHVFLPGQVAIKLNGSSVTPERRLPGALAAIHSDRRNPELPAYLHITGESGVVNFELVFRMTNAAQLILAEPTRPGAGYINECIGNCDLIVAKDSAVESKNGVGIFEYVE